MVLIRSYHIVSFHSQFAMAQGSSDQQTSGGGSGAGGPSQAMRSAGPGTTSQTQTQAQTQSPILRLRGAQRNRGPRVQWAESVVDNEGMGKKSSKGRKDNPTRQSLLATLLTSETVCCIYHAPKAVDESSDESSSDSSSSSSDDSDSDSGEGPSRRVNGDHAGKDCGHKHKHGRGRRRDDEGRRKRKPSPNAYEKVPKPKPKDGAGGSGPVGTG